MSRRAVNIATISEEDIWGEEIGEDGMVERVSTPRQDEERSEAEGAEGWSIRKRDSSSSLDSEKRSSLIERDNGESGEVSSSILKAISSFDGPSAKTSLSRSKSTESIPYSSLSRPQPTPKDAAPSSSNMRRTASWRGSRAPGSTMNLSGKFVTELTLYDPFSGPVKCSCINLGMFIATDQTMGDHFVYKMSPVSPLTALKIQQQDRLLKVNDINVMGWSHNCLVEFIRSLPLSFVINSGESKDTVFEMPLNMEFRKSGKAIRSAEESPSSKKVTATVRLRKQRATVLSVHEALVRVRYSTTSTARIRLKTDLNLYLKTSTSPQNVVSFHAGQQISQDDAVYFRLHHFDVSPPRTEKGRVVVIETPGGDGYLHATSLDSVTVMHGTPTPPNTLFQTDVRFFHLANVPGCSAVRIKNIHTGRYLSANKDTISLVGLGEDMLLPKETEFEILEADC